MFERAGVPSAVLITEPFAGSARAMAMSQGAPDYPWVTVPHPIATQSDHVLQAWAEEAAPKVVRLLLKSAEA